MTKHRIYKNGGKFGEAEFNRIKTLKSAGLKVGQIVEFTGWSYSLIRNALRFPTLQEYKEYKVKTYPKTRRLKQGTKPLTGPSIFDAYKTPATKARSLDKQLEVMTEAIRRVEIELYRLRTSLPKEQEKAKKLWFSK